MSLSPRNAIGSCGNQNSLVGIGVTFSRDKVTGQYVVKRVVDGGSAWRCRKVKQGDIFHEVDGVSVCSIDPEGLRRFVCLQLYNQVFN